MEEFESKKNFHLNKIQKEVCHNSFCQVNIFLVLSLLYYFLNNLTSSVLFCYTKDMNYIPPLLHWSMMIDFINVFTDDNTL